MNFTEELVSWYLRFNGFFPIDNFVLHAIRCQCGKGSFDKHNADSDVIAIRPRSVMEIINGHPLKWAEEFGTERWGIGALEGPWPRNVAILVEVKFRKVFDKDALAAVEKSFCDCRVIPALKRCGLNPAEMALVPGKPFYENKEKDWYFAKCIALDHEDQFSKLSKSIKSECLLLSLAEAEMFLQQRFKLHVEKIGGKLFFNDSFIQYIAWKTKVDVAELNEACED